MSRKKPYKNINSFLKDNYIIEDFLSYSDVESMHNEWLSNNGVNFNDFLWSLFNKSLLINGEVFSKSLDGKIFFQNNYFLYLGMAYFRRKEGDSVESVNQYIRLAFEAEIEKNKYFDSSDIEMEVVVIGKNSQECTYANSINGRRYEVDSFLNECHIATNKCTSKYNCSCSIASVVKRDDNGNIIRKSRIPETKDNEIYVKKEESKGCLPLLILIIIVISIVF